MDNLKKFFIDGKWVEPATSETMKVLNPSNDETIGIVALGSDEDVNNAVKVAKRAFETYSKTTKKRPPCSFERAKICNGKKVRRFGASYAARNGRSNFNGTFSSS